LFRRVSRLRHWYCLACAKTLKRAGVEECPICKTPVLTWTVERMDPVAQSDVDAVVAARGGL
jgi:hypothetical protein